MSRSCAICRRQAGALRESRLSRASSHLGEKLKSATKACLDTSSLVYHHLHQQEECASYDCQHGIAKLLTDGGLPAASHGCSFVAIPDYSKWTVTSDWIDRCLQLHVSNISQPKCGHTEVEERELSNEYQLDETYRFHEDSGDLRNPSKILISYLGQEKNRSNSTRYQQRG